MKNLLLILVIGLAGCSTKPFKEQTLGEQTGTVVGWTIAAPFLILKAYGDIKVA